MPELPEVEITARRLSAALKGAAVESALAPGLATMKSFDPPLDALERKSITGVRRIGKMPIVDFSGDLSLLIHLMSAGRLQVYDKRASLKDRRSRILIRLTDGRELRLREFGTKQAAWGRLLPTGQIADEEMIATLGPEAWPAPAPDVFAKLVEHPKHLHPMLRNQRVIAGIGRSWVDEILWEAELSPFKQGTELDSDEVERLHSALHVLDDAIHSYEESIGDDLPDKLPMPLRIHKRQGEPCPRCGTKLEAVYFSEHETEYCPDCQTGGRVLKDRRLSRLLK